MREATIGPGARPKGTIVSCCNTAMTHRFGAPATLGVVTLAFLTGCVAPPTLVAESCVPEPPSDLSELSESGREVYEEVELMPTMIDGPSTAIERLNYPAAARNARVDGRVVVSFIVNKQGRAKHAMVTECLGWGGLDEEALRAIREMRFNPGMQDGEPVLVRMEIPFTFSVGPEKYF